MRNLPDNVRVFIDGVRRNGWVGFARESFAYGYPWHVATVWLNRHHLGRKTTDVAGFEFKVPHRTEGIVEELIVFGVHEPVAGALYSEILVQGETVLDIGTNLGYYLAVASKRIAPNGSIWGFEPDPELFECAVANSRVLPARVLIHKIAVSEVNGHATFHRSSMSNQGSLLYSRDLLYESSITTETVRLDDFCVQNDVQPTVLRMDIEGGEAAALRGARGILEERPKLFIEVHPGLLGKEELVGVLTQLADTGYERVVAVSRPYDVPWVSAKHRMKGVRHTTIELLLELARTGGLSLSEFERVPPAFSVIAGSEDAS